MCTTLFVVVLLLCCGAVRADAFCDHIDTLELRELAPTFDTRKVERLLAGTTRSLTGRHRQAAAVLVAAGVVAVEDLDSPERVAGKVAAFSSVLNNAHPALQGRIADALIPMPALAEEDYRELLEALPFLEKLGALLSRGVITGYDLRARGVFDQAQSKQSLVYSHSSWRHLRQLIALLNSEGVDGWVYVAPKVSAFLYRDGWGGDGENVVTLPGGARVVQAREVATLFAFDSGGDRQRFHDLVTRFGKKDSASEPGLIADSWWQPFYYGVGPLQDFAPISLVVVTNEAHEATLTVLEEKTTEVIAALAGYDWAVRLDRVWVNPPFYRFLKGDFK